MRSIRVSTPTSCSPTMLGDDGGDGIFSANRDKMSISRQKLFSFRRHEHAENVCARIILCSLIIVANYDERRYMLFIVVLRTSLAVSVGNLFRTARELVFGRRYVTTIVLVLLVMMASYVIQFLVNSARKYEGR